MTVLVYRGGQSINRYVRQEVISCQSSKSLLESRVGGTEWLILELCTLLSLCI